MRSSFVVAALVLLASGIVAATQSQKANDLPYAGKWKLNVARSDFGETTITIARTASGQMQFTTAGQSYTFQVDGKDYPSLFGRTTAWKQIDANTWESTTKQSGKVVSTETTTVSADGKTLSMTLKGLKPGGGTFDQTIVHERVSGGSGLAGKWKTKNYSTSPPTVLELAASGTDGLTIKVPDLQITCEAKFDGKDYPVTGPTVPPGLTMALEKTAPRSFDITEKQDGKTLFALSFALSGDGKTLTETGSAIGVSEKFTAVYERQ